jgi:(R,R)-butanediol dehydrogenase/meso-butanediol dehydrogenase/diacetyl reductase
MQAAMFHGKGDIRIEDVAVPDVGPDDIRVQVAAVGICGTDASEFSAGPAMFPIDHVHRVSGHRGPMIPGHEFSGYVNAVGANVTSVSVGDLVASGAALPCRVCDLCRQGHPNLCADNETVGLHRNGALAEMVVLPARGVVRASDYGLTADAAALAQPMAIAVHAMRRGSPAKDSAAVVIGCGGIGAFLIFALAHVGVRVTGVDVSLERLGIAAQLGASNVLEAGRKLPSVPLVFEVSGTQAGLDAAVASVSPAGRIVTIGIPKGNVTYDARRITLNEIEIIGSNALDNVADVERALELIAVGGDVWSLVAPRAIPLSDAVGEGISALSEGRATVIKILIDPTVAAARGTTFRCVQSRE